MVNTFCFVCFLYVVLNEELTLDCLRSPLFKTCLVAGWICKIFENNRAFYDKSITLGTWLVDTNTKKLRDNATPKMSIYGRHLVFPKWRPIFSLFIKMSLYICKYFVLSI